MKMIAHRGASLVFQENSVESLAYAAKIGAYAVECDIRQTRDKRYVIFHDDDLKRTAGLDAKVSDLTLQQMRYHLEERGYSLLTYEDLTAGYKEKTPILLHIKFTDVTPDFVAMLRASGIDFICGIQTPDLAKLFAAAFPNDRILAFMPDKNGYAEFAKSGAGIIRLWEHWLPGMDLKRVGEEIGDKEIWIMSCDKDGSMNGSSESLDSMSAIGADGVLLNDIVLGMEWKKDRSQGMR